MCLCYAGTPVLAHQTVCYSDLIHHIFDEKIKRKSKAKKETIHYLEGMGPPSHHGEGGYPPSKNSSLPYSKRQITYIFNQQIPILNTFNHGI